MKYVILRCEDEAPAGEHTASLLDGAKTSHLQQLAQAGSAGTVRTREERSAFDRAQIHRALLGLGERDRDVAPGRWYAASANLEVSAGATAWCCELVTHRDGRIVDPTAGRIPTKESEALIRALNDQLGSDARRWTVGEGPHHILVTRDPALETEAQAPIRPPELLVGQPWTRHLPKGPLGDAMEALILEASKLLEAHPVNRVRVDLGENPANLLWLWGAGGARPHRTFTERTGLSGAVVSPGFLMRGLAHALGLAWKEGPASCEESAVQRVTKTVGSLLERHDFVYVHLRVASADPVERLCAMERLDQLLLKPVSDHLPALGPGRILAVIDDRPRRWLSCVAVGTGLAQQPIAQLSAQSFADSPLTFKDVESLFTWFTAR